MYTTLNGRSIVWTACINEGKENADEVAREIWANGRVSICPECKQASVIQPDGSISRIADWKPDVVEAPVDQAPEQPAATEPVAQDSTAAETEAAT